jgi:hypothetical protein
MDFNFFVQSTIKCPPPILDIVSRAPSLKEPSLFKRSDLFSIVATMTINCNATLFNLKQWTMFEVISAQTYSEQQITLSTNPTVNYAELVIQPQTLLVGLYRFVFTLSLTLSTPVSSQIDTYVQIAQSGLVISALSLSQPMYGGSIEITRGSNQTIVFNPFTFSYDIDRQAVMTSLAFKYACQVIDANVPRGYPQVIGSNKTVYLDEFKSNASLAKLLECFNTTGNILGRFQNAQK